MLRGRRDALRQANQRAKAQLSALQKEQHLLEEQLAQVPADAAAKKVAEAWDATGSAVGARAANHAEIVGGTRWELCLRASELWEATEESEARRLLSPPFDVGGARWQLLVIIEGGHLSAYVDLVGAAGGRAPPHRRRRRRRARPLPNRRCWSARQGGVCRRRGGGAGRQRRRGGEGNGAAAAARVVACMPPHDQHSEQRPHEERGAHDGGGGRRRQSVLLRAALARRRRVRGGGGSGVVSTSAAQRGFVVDGSNPPCIVIEAELKLQPTGVDWSDEASVSAELGVAVRHLEGLDEKLRNEKKRLAALRKGALEFDARAAPPPATRSGATGSRLSSGR